MSDIPALEKQSFIQRNPAWVIGMVFGAVLSLYLYHFHNGFSTSQETWGQFGDFIGGVVNPIIGFFTILLLAVSLRQNHAALRQANLALEQAKVELGLTRDAIVQAGELQKATEDALKEQINIAAHARDMNNAMALHTHLMAANHDINTQKQENGAVEPHLDEALNQNQRSLGYLATILAREERRLIETYCHDIFRRD